MAPGGMSKAWGTLPISFSRDQIVLPPASAAASGIGDGQCGLMDGSSPGHWRLPTQTEFEATMAPAVAAGCSFSLVGGLPSLTETADACWQELEQSGSGDASGWPAVVSVIYLAGTDQQPEPTVTWLTLLGSGESNFIGRFGQGLGLRVWPVRTARTSADLDKPIFPQVGNGPP